MYEENYELLCEAVIVQAAKDYRSTDSVYVRREVRQFFYSDWFNVLSNADGRAIFEALKEERKQKLKKRTKGGQKC